MSLTSPVRFLQLIVQADTSVMARSASTLATTWAWTFMAAVAPWSFFMADFMVTLQLLRQTLKSGTEALNPGSLPSKMVDATAPASVAASMATATSEEKSTVPGAPAMSAPRGETDASVVWMSRRRGPSSLTQCAGKGPSLHVVTSGLAPGGARPAAAAAAAGRRRTARASASTVGAAICFSLEL
uniref:Uncharacterized protein n=1 Tax=Triticum urartu TaxID=4572 RepID=A0A8R7Q6M3_TRIUA